jgi:hypothetical protein
MMWRSVKKSEKKTKWYLCFGKENIKKNQITVLIIIFFYIKFNDECINYIG